jgi:hypothetical protein
MYVLGDDWRERSDGGDTSLTTRMRRNGLIRIGKVSICAYSGQEGLSST